ncbi:MAG: ATP-binding protein, partial [Chromatiaceae bacterium]
RLRLCVDKTQEMVTDVRRMAMALRPTVIDTSGVLVALTRLCQELKDIVRGLSVHLTTDVEERDIDEGLKIHIFRIVQEALNNVIKYAEARNVWIKLDRCGAAIRLIVRDDGVGFDPGDTAAPARGLGLSSIRQRGGLYNGQVSIESEPGRGTTVCAIWGGAAETSEASSEALEGAGTD